MGNCKKCYNKDKFCTDCLKEIELEAEMSATRYFKGFDLRMGKELFFYPETNSYWVRITPRKADIMTMARGPHNIYKIRRNIKVLDVDNYHYFFPSIAPKGTILLHNLFFILDSIRGDEGLLRFYGYNPMSMLFQDQIAISTGMKRMLREISKSFLLVGKQTT